MRPSYTATEETFTTQAAPTQTGVILVMCNDLNVATTDQSHHTSPRQQIEELLREEGYALLDTRLVTRSPELATGRPGFGAPLARTIVKNTGNPQSGVTGVPRVIVVSHDNCANFRAALTSRHHTPSPSRVRIIRDGYRRELAKHLHRALAFWTRLSGHRHDVTVELRLWTGDKLITSRQFPAA